MIYWIALILTIALTFKLGRIIQAWEMDVLLNKLGEVKLCPDCQERLFNHLKRIKWIKEKIEP